MTFKIIRLLFILSCSVMGVLWVMYGLPNLYPEGVSNTALIPWCILGGLIGIVVGIGVLFLLSFVTQDIFERISPALVAIALALVTGYVLARFIFDLYLPDSDPVFQVFVVCTLVLLFGYVGISMGLTRASNWESLMAAVHRRQNGDQNPIIVDTSVIIDGRIVDICKTGFIDGTLIVPRFVLKELQNIADSADVLRRMRGRRGLDIVKVLQEPESKVRLRVTEDDPAHIDEVDGKLVQLGRDYGAKVMTNDLNLNKVAQIEGVPVLNINDLANALKPAVLPDENMEVKIVKEGKEAYQGVGYLDDGTMVVVDGGKNYVGKDVSVIVTSVLQTSAGRMIFTKLQNVLS
jgi:uncharacterized protein YacL